MNYEYTVAERGGLLMRAPKISLCPTASQTLFPTLDSEMQSLLAGYLFLLSVQHSYCTSRAWPLQSGADIPQIRKNKEKSTVA